eukprot:s792_g10.t1
MTPPSQPEPRADRTSAVGSDGQAPVDRVYSAAEVDERGRLKPKPKQRPAQLRQTDQTTESEIPRDARLEIMAGDLVLRTLFLLQTTALTDTSQSRARIAPDPPGLWNPHSQTLRETWISDWGPTMRSQATAPFHLVHGR